VRLERNPWMKFYPADWRSDAMLRLCSIAARGLWTEMMCLMHEADPYGSLLVNGKRIDKRQLAGLAGISEKDCSALLIELEGNGVFSRDDDGTIYSRRMRRDFEKAAKDKANGKGGGNPRLKGGVNPPDNGVDKAQKPEARNQKEDSDANASGAEAPDPRTRLFREGLAKVAAMTGKGQDSCRTFVGKCLKEASDDASVVLGLIEDAERNRVVNPGAWISARLKGTQNGPKSRSSVIQAADDLCERIASFDGPGNGGGLLRGGEGAPSPRLLSHR
jgi:hypothetical protein